MTDLSDRIAERAKRREMEYSSGQNVTGFVSESRSTIAAFEAVVLVAAQMRTRRYAKSPGDFYREEAAIDAALDNLTALLKEASDE